MKHLRKSKRNSDLSNSNATLLVASWLVAKFPGGEMTGNRFSRISHCFGLHESDVSICLQCPEHAMYLGQHWVLNLWGYCIMIDNRNGETYDENLQ